MKPPAKSIICFDCEKPIEYRKDLAVVGQLLLPVHKSCLRQPQKKQSRLHKSIGRFPLRSFFWFWLVLENALFAYLLVTEAESRTVLYIFATVCNLVYIGFRIGIYFSYEKHLR